MVSFIFVHGGNMSSEAWNELTTGDPVHTSDGLMGGRIWDTALSALADQGIQGYAPTLGDEKSSNLTDHITQICSLVHEHDLDTIILVGHSYGGMVITGVAARMPEKISHLVYIDAAYPESGQSLYDIMLSGGQDPSSYAGFVPDPPYVERIVFDPQTIASIPKTYVYCSNSNFSILSHAVKEKIALSDGVWTWYEVPASHVPMAEMPDEVNRILFMAAFGE